METISSTLAALMALACIAALTELMGKNYNSSGAGLITGLSAAACLIAACSAFFESIL